MTATASASSSTRRAEHWASLRDAPGFVIGVSGALPSEPQTRLLRGEPVS
jgi:hypothetical protein